MNMDEVKKIADMMKQVSGQTSLVEQMKNLYQVPSFREFARPEPIKIPKLPTTAERHSYESAGVLIDRLATRIRRWQTDLPEDAQPVILAVLSSGVTIRVTSLAQESHHGIAVTGLIEDNECLLLAHQATLQLLCYIEKITAETPRRPIGFYIQPEAATSAEDE